MLALLISLVALGLILLIATYFARRKNTTAPQMAAEPTEECCGAHEVCDKDSLLVANANIVYYDDEELDALAHIPPKDFTGEQKKQLYEVFYTLKETDVAGWLCSLQLRNIQLPMDLREEALLIVSERRAG